MAGESSTGLPTSGAAPGEQAEPTLLELDKIRLEGGPGTGTGRRWQDGERRLLKDWLARTTAAQHAHFYLMGRYRKLNLWLGGAVVVLTTVVGTRLFATLGNGTKVPVALRAFVASVSVLAAALAAIQTFLKFAERAEKHGVAADWFAAVRRDIDLVAATPEVERGDPKKAFEVIRKEVNRAAQIAPEIGERVWHRFARKYGVKEPAQDWTKPSRPPSGGSKGG